MLNKSENIKNLATALMKFHTTIGIVKKTDVNPFFKNAYASLPTILTAINTPLLEAGLSVTQFPVGENELSTLLMHAESGEWIEGTFKMTPSKNDPQGQGSVISYQRRYALGAILSLNIDIDDDGNAISKPKPYQAKAFTPKPNIVAPQEETAPGIEIKDNFKIWTDKVKMAQDLETINGYAENLKFATKTMKPSEVALLRSQFANKRKELESGEIVI